MSRRLKIHLMLVNSKYRKNVPEQSGSEIAQLAEFCFVTIYRPDINKARGKGNGNVSN